MVNWPWKRNKSKVPDNVPPEIQEYYQAEKRERVGVAWALALATLIVTVLLALGLFYGGRWAYRAIFDNDENPAVVQQDDTNQQPGGNNGDEGDTSSEETPTTEQPATLPGEDANDTNNQAEDSAGEEPEAPATTPTAGQDIPETGPGDMTALFIAVSAISYVLHRLVSNYRART